MSQSELFTMAPNSNWVEFVKKYGQNCNFSCNLIKKLPLFQVFKLKYFEKLREMNEKEPFASTQKMQCSMCSNLKYKVDFM